MRDSERWNLHTGAVPSALAAEAVLLQYCVDSEFDTCLYELGMQLLTGRWVGSISCGELENPAPLSSTLVVQEATGQSTTAYGLPHNPYYVCVNALKRYALRYSSLRAGGVGSDLAVGLFPVELRAGKKATTQSWPESSVSRLWSTHSWAFSRSQMRCVERCHRSEQCLTCET